MVKLSNGFDDMESCRKKVCKDRLFSSHIKARQSFICVIVKFPKLFNIHRSFDRTEYFYK